MWIENIRYSWNKINKNNTLLNLNNNEGKGEETKLVSLDIIIILAFDKIC